MAFPAPASNLVLIYIQVRLIVDYGTHTNSGGDLMPLYRLVRRDIPPCTARDQCHHPAGYQPMKIICPTFGWHSSSRLRFLLQLQSILKLQSSFSSVRTSGWPSTPSCCSASSPSPTLHCFFVLAAIKSPAIIQSIDVSLRTWS